MPDDLAIPRGRRSHARETQLSRASNGDNEARNAPQKSSEMGPVPLFSNFGFALACLKRRATNRPQQNLLHPAKGIFFIRKEKFPLTSRRRRPASCKPALR